MRLSVRHITRYAYEPEAARVAFRLRLFPGQTASQTPVHWRVTVNGEAPSEPIVNAWGDREAIWLKQGRVAEIEILAEGEVDTMDRAGVLERWEMAARPRMFLRETPLTAPDKAVAALAEQATAAGEGLAAAHALSALVREKVDYAPGATEAGTTAAEALRLGQGVCQDHAQIFICAARVLGAPARYVSGYLLSGGEDDLIGETTKTHAWAEIWVEGLGWVGFDPTNQVCPTDRYIRVASGLDAADAAPLRGAVSGAAEEHLEADVIVANTAQ